MGSPECPCLDVPQVNPFFPNCTIVEQGDEVFCYSVDYGRYCNTWDESLEPYCSHENDDVPDWCFQSWCYVDATKCIESTVQMSLSVIHDGLFFSYETCGSEDTWSQYNIRNALQGRKLKVGIPALW